MAALAQRGSSNASRVLNRHPRSYVGIPAVSRRAAVQIRKRDVARFAADNGAEDIAVKINESLDKAGTFIKEKWEKTDEKPAAVAITVVVFFGIWAASAVVDSVDRVPVVNGFFKLVGIFVTSWFVYRNLLFGPDREELYTSIKEFIKKVSGEA